MIESHPSPCSVIATFLVAGYYANSLLVSEQVLVECAVHQMHNDLLLGGVVCVLSIRDWVGSVNLCPPAAQQWIELEVGVLMRLSAPGPCTAVA